MLYCDINNLPIGNSLEVGNGVNAIKNSKDTVALDNGSVYSFESLKNGNVKFIKRT